MRTEVLSVGIFEFCKLYTASFGASVPQSVCLMEILMLFSPAA